MSVEKSSLLPVFIHKVLLEHNHTHSLCIVYGCLWIQTNLGHCSRDHGDCKPTISCYVVTYKKVFWLLYPSEWHVNISKLHNVREKTSPLFLSYYVMTSSLKDLLTFTLLFSHGKRISYLVGKSCSLAYVATLDGANLLRGYKSWVFITFFADPHFPDGLCYKLDWGIRKYIKQVCFSFPR